MSKVLLTLEDAYEFTLIGISSHTKDYRLCWELNKYVELDLIRTEDLEINSKDVVGKYAFYEYLDEENYLDYYLIANRGNNGYLVPERKTFDYLLMIKGDVEDYQEEELLGKIRSLDHVLASYSIDPNELKSKQNLFPQR